MKKILTFFTAFAVAVVFAFLLSASPPTVSAQSTEMEKFSVEKTQAVQSGFAIFRKVNLPGFKFTLEAESEIKFKTFLVPKSAAKLAKFERITYESPPKIFFAGVGFDNQARAKI